MICTKEDACVLATVVGEQRENERQKEGGEERRVAGTEGGRETKKNFPCCT